MSETSTSRRYHVVCRDCRHEHLAGERSEAQSVAAAHADDTTHRVAFARID